jgi:hypothetical protein
MTTIWRSTAIRWIKLNLVGGMRIAVIAYADFVEMRTPSLLDRHRTGESRRCRAALAQGGQASAPTWFLLVAAFIFPQYDREAAAAEAEALRDRSFDPNLGTVAGHAVSLAVHPNLARPIVHLIDPGAESSERIAYSSTDGNFPARVPPRISKNSVDAGACWTRGQDQRPHDKQ